MKAKPKSDESTTIGCLTLNIHSNHIKMQANPNEQALKLQGQLHSNTVSNRRKTCASALIRPSTQNQPSSITQKGVIKESSDSVIIFPQANQEPKMNNHSRLRQSIAALMRLTKGSQLRKKNLKKQDVKLEWSGFFLTKNTDCSFEPYYCGNCRILFQAINQFIKHCLSECQMTKHKDSSHFITSNPEEETFKQNKNSLVEEGSNLKIKEEYQQAKIQQENEKCLEKKIKQIEPFRQILKKKLDHRNFPFYCGFCKREMTEHAFYLDIFKNHAEKIQPSSSHVILKCKRSDLRFIYLSPYVKWPHDNPDYFCPCRPQRKISMKGLIEHIMNVHQGVSPIYELVLHLRSKGQSSINQKRAKIQPQIIQLQTSVVESEPNLREVMSRIVENTVNLSTNSSHQQFRQINAIRQIYLKNQDHRTSSFFCGVCKHSFKKGFGYFHHMRIFHNHKITRQSSHIVLQISASEGTFNIYLTPTIKWSIDSAEYCCSCQYEEKMTMSQLIQHVFQEHEGISPAYAFSKKARKKGIEERYMLEHHLEEVILLNCNQPMKKLINLHISHKRVPFYCGACRQYLTSENYAIHMIKVHQKKIGNDSSHILVKVEDVRKLSHYFCISLNGEAIDNEEVVLYCPCKPKQKLEQTKLIQHVLQVHSGVSPTYTLTAEMS